MMDVQELLLIFLGDNGIVVKTFLVLQQWFSMGGVDFASPGVGSHRVGHGHDLVV